MGLDRAHWSNANAVRAIFRKAFERAGISNVNPHSCRDTFVQLAYALNLGPEQFKVWSQKLGHEHVLTTFSSYGSITRHRHEEIMIGLTQAMSMGHEDDLPPELMRMLKKLITKG